MSRHFSREAWLQLLRGPANEAETVRAIRHVVHCRRCRASGAGCLVQAKAGGSLPFRPTDARNSLVAILEAEASGWVEDITAGSWWAEIRNLGPEAQIKKIRSTTSLQSLPVFEAILADARATALSDPFLGESKVRAALMVVDLLPEPRYPRTLKNDLRGEAMTVVANCRRLAADFPGSTAAIEEARRHLAQGTGDPGLEAGLLSIHCSLCTDLGDFEKALAHVRRAVEIFRDLEDWQAVAHNAVKEASCLLAACRPAEGIERAQFALERMPPQELRLQTLAKLALVEGLVLLERPLEAFPYFMEAKSLSEHVDAGTRLRVVYFAARLLDSFDRERESEKLFRHTVKAYFDQELYKEAFITLLTLFECLCRRGALGKAAALCEEAITATSQAGAACNEQIRRAWEELLAVVRVRQLSESELIQARQYLVRNWSVAAGTFRLPRVEAAIPSASLRPEVPEPPPPMPDAEDSAPSSLRAAHEEYDRRLIATALEQAGGNQSEASRRLGISRTTLRTKMRLYGL
ncbi:MAG TPA: helix-turn-helix domain-containing protein [Thermoanaerobaculia bacterium]|nr:helix-turn-helix domain-containing protein [Thermoanaerobaculia bacterium]